MTIGSEADIDSLDITPDEFYTKVTDEDLKEIEELDAKYKGSKKKRVAKKAKTDE